MLNPEVTRFLDDQKHPFRKEIEQLRLEILNVNKGLKENIKWNGPNFTFNDEDRITMRIQPPKQLQLIFHRGAKVLAQPKERLIGDDEGLLDWKANDRAVATFKNMEAIKTSKAALGRIVNAWLKAT